LGCFSATQNGSFIIAIEAIDDNRSYRFDKVFFQEGIDVELLKVILSHNTWSNFGLLSNVLIAMVNEDCEVVEMSNYYFGLQKIRFAKMMNEFNIEQTGDHEAGDASIRLLNFN
jgi:hypothetical protein